MKYLALLLLLAACTVTTPYVAVLPLDPNEPTAIGQMKCDLDGHPYMLISGAISSEEAYWVRAHEKIHVEQVRRFGKCADFTTKYTNDLAFRLSVEASAFCGVYRQQLESHVTPYPGQADIAYRLQNKYGANWTDEEIRRAMLTCRELSQPVPDSVRKLFGLGAPLRAGYARR